MRVLWFTNNPCNLQFEGRINSYNAGGWMTALQDEIMKCNEIELGICFIANNLPSEIKQKGVTYFPVAAPHKKLIDKIKGYMFFRSLSVEENLWNEYIIRFRNVINRFHPDIIQVFGSEKYMGLAAFSTSLPLVLHIQGVLNPCNDVYFPPGISVKDYYLQDKNPRRIFKRYFDFLWWKRSCCREKHILSQVNHYIGRTDWDKRVTYIFNPKAQYHFGEEIMRPSFYRPIERRLPKQLTITTTISAPYYKGYDLILKTANILKNSLHLSFMWLVYGNVNPIFVEKVLGLRHKDLNIELKGVVDAEEIQKAHASATVYVHSSYLENSCNSVIEAQMTGCPVVANYVGGLTTIVKDGINGFLVPANDPYQTAYLIKYLYEHPEENLSMGRHAAEDAFARHDKKKIVKSLLDTYNEIISASLK